MGTTPNFDSFLKQYESQSPEVPTADLDSFLAKYETTPNASRVSGRQPVFEGKKRVMDISGSMPRVQRLIDAFQSGAAQQVQAAGSFMEALTPWKDEGQAVRQAASEYMIPTMSFTDLLAKSKPPGTDEKSVGSWLGELVADSGQFVAENVINQVPNIAGSLVSGLAGGVAGGVVGAKLGPVGAAAGTTAGIVGSQFAYNYFLNAGETYADLREKGVTREAAATTAGFTGAAKAVLDTALPAKLGGKLAAKLGMKVAWIPKDAMGKAPNLARDVFSGMAIEGGTEAGQELLDMLAEQRLNVYTPGEGVARVLNAAAAGAVGGGAFSGMTYAAERLMEKRAAQEPEEGLDPKLTETPPEETPPAQNPPTPPPSMKDLPGVIKNKVMELGGTKALFKSYTEGEMKGVLGMGKDASLRPLVNAGLIEEVEGNFAFTKLINGEGTLMQHEEMPGLFFDVAEAGSPSHYIFMDAKSSPSPIRIEAPPFNPETGMGGYFQIGDNRMFDTLEEAYAYAKERDPNPGVQFEGVPGALVPSRSYATLTRKIAQKFGMDLESPSTASLPESLKPSLDPVPEKNTTEPTAPVAGLSMGIATDWANPPGPRWTGDPGAMPGEPVYYLDVDDERLDSGEFEEDEGLPSAAAIVPFEMPDYTYVYGISLRMEDGDYEVIGPYDNLDTAARAAEYLADKRSGKIIEAGPQLARTADGKIRADLDRRQGLQYFRKSIYSAAPALSALKEALQNSLDAVRKTPGGEVTVEYRALGDNNYQLVVDDNGTGMSRELIETAYSNIAEQSEKSKDLNNSGGFGVAMAAIFSAGPIHVITTTRLADGSFERSEFRATPDELFGTETSDPTGVEVVTERFPASANLKTGTRTELTLGSDSKGYSAFHFLNNLKYSSNLPGRVKILQKRYTFDDESVEVIEAGQPFRGAQKLFSHNVPGIANVDVYGSDAKIQKSGRGRIEVAVLNNGFYQFTHNIFVDEQLGLPERMSFDVKALIKPGEKSEYPFSLNREALKTDIMEALGKLVDEKLVKPRAKNALNLLQETYANMPTFPGVRTQGLMAPVLLDSGQRLLPHELQALLTNPAVQNFVKTVGWVTKLVKDKLAANPELWRKISGQHEVLGRNIERVGLLLSEKAMGVWVPKPGSGGKATIMLNPFIMFENAVANPQPVPYGYDGMQVETPAGIYKATRYVDGRYYITALGKDLMDKPYDTLELATTAMTQLASKDFPTLSPHQVVASLWETLRHEILHDIWNEGDHGPDFATGANLLATILGEDYFRFQREIEYAITKRTAKGEVEIHPALIEALQIYRQSRARPETAPDLLGDQKSGTAGNGSASGRNRGGQARNQGNLGGSRGTGNGWPSSEPVTPTPANDRFGSKALKSFSRMLRNVAPEAQAGVKNHFGYFYQYMRHAYFLTQQIERNPENPFGKQYLSAMREWTKARTKVLLNADALNRKWHKLGADTLKRVGLMTRRVEEKSYQLERRLSTQELVEIAAELGGNAELTMQAWQEIDLSMQQALQLLYQSLVNEAIRTYGMAASLRIFEIDNEFVTLRNRNYFPAIRFGKFGVKVIATEKMEWAGKTFKKGQTIIFETEETRRSGIKLREQLKRDFAGKGAVVEERYLTDVEQSFLNMPESLVKLLEDRLMLSEEGLSKLKQLQHELSPGRGLVKHLIKKKGVLGASLDVPRVYNDYYRKLAGHIARLETSYMAEEALAGAKDWANKNSKDYNAHLFAEALEQHYKDVQSPASEFGALAGAIYTLVFGFNPLSAVVNLTQVPALTYPFLAKRVGDVVATKALVLAMKKVGGSIIRNPAASPSERNESYTGEDRAMFDRAVEDGFLNESMAGEVAAMASGNLMTRYFERGLTLNYYTQKTLGYSVILHRLAEEYNRRVTFQAALEAGRHMKLSGDKLYEFARDAVDKTQFEYSSWNRPHMMRGKTAILFVFKAYLQNFLYFAGTNQGGVRFWLMLVAIGGLRGLPGSDDILDTLEMLGTWAGQFLGLKNPRVDLEKEARDFIEAVGLNPDLAMNGLARYSFGLAGLNHFFGIPFPSADFSSSVQLARIVPFIRAIKGTTEGTMSWNDAVASAVADVTGAAGTMGLNFTRAVLEDSPMNAGRFWAISSAARNLGKAFEMAHTGAYRSADGKALVNVDLAKAEHWGEIFAQALGKKPTRVSKAQEGYFATREYMAFHFAWRDAILTKWAVALAEKDSAEQDVARREWKRFAQTAPPEFILRGKDLKQSLVQRIKGRKLKELGLPPQEQFIRIYRDYQESFGVNQSPE